MTVEVETARVSYTGAGTTGPFTIPFYFLANADIRAIKVTIADGTEAELTLTTDFTLTGAGEEAGGELTLVASISSSFKLVIFRDPEVLQESDYPRNDPFPSETHEEVADRLTMIAQRHANLLERSVRLPDGDSSGTSMVLPGVTSRQSKFLAFDADGAITAVDGSDGTSGSLAVALAASSGASLVGVIQSGSGAIAETTSDALQRLPSSGQYSTEANFNTAREALTERVDTLIRVEGDQDDQLLSHAIRGRVAVLNTMVTVVCGNSITAQSQFNAHGGSASHIATDSEIHHANDLAGAPMRFKRVVASTRTDEYGIYGYSGQTLATINSDLSAQWFDPLNAAGVIPDLVIGHALIENDIVASATTAQMEARLTEWIRNVQHRWPKAKILLCTPHPSFSYNTAALVTAYESMRDYILGLDDGQSIFVAQIDDYEDPADPGVPLSGYTDASVHPNAKGALVNGRTIAAVFSRMAKVWKEPYRCLSTNMPMSGSGAASGTNVTGTIPTGVTITGAADGTFVAEAEQPGFELSVTTAVKAAEPPYDLSTFNFGAQTVTGAKEVSPFMVVQIVSGASALRSIELAPRMIGGSNPFVLYMQSQTNNTEPTYEDGDVLTLRSPPIVAEPDGYTSVTVFGRVRMKLAGGTTVLRILSQGVGIVSESKNNVNTTAVGNVGGSEDNLITYSLPLDTLTVNGYGVRITAWGTTANNSNPKTVKLYFGSVAILTTALTVSQVGTWRITAHVLRTGSDAQDYSSQLLQGGATTLVDVENGTATENDGAAITIKCTGTVTDGGGGINNDDIVQEGMHVELIRY